MNTITPARDVILERVIAALSETLDELPVEPMGPHTDLFRDLRIDSVDMMSFVGRLEDAYDRDFPPEAFLQVRTLGELASQISGRLAAERAQ